ncbi:hypothetical protein MARLIPOL_11146 [Marinobacter lipolyticus SM19]|uniref:Cytochrome c domain-containing protein n=1 Tax=Marinobacter lipolyticus SM19 TaxID=1318628 RepID=R8B0S5_9GAMM|nr:cytochrome c peroxidase [Marinobacter lipolyticus]EON92174.1 hypothetical protein MARLIPOL_11146 [Marinobacter lipolyticus SM19]
MSTDTNRKELLRKLSRNLMVSVPVMTVVAMAGATAVSDNGFSLIPSAEAAQGEAEGEARGEAEGEAKGEAEGEGEAKGEAEGEGEGEAEGVSEAKKEAVRRPEGYTPYQGDAGSLAEKGKVLFNDTSLSSNGLACATCHTNGAGYADTFSNDYPHFVAMGKSDFGMDMVHLDEMVQICMVAPMASQPLDWASDQLAALTEYMRIEQEKFRNK